MAVKGIHERRHQYARAKARAKRKLKRRFENQDFQLDDKERDRIIATHASVRRKCSCWLCKRDDWEESRQGLRAKADKDDQIG